MKRMILITTLALGVFSCEKKEVEPRTDIETTTKKFRIAGYTGLESISINGVVTIMGTMGKGEFVDSVAANLPVGVVIKDSRSSWFYISGYTTFQTTGAITVIKP